MREKIEVWTQSITTTRAQLAFFAGALFLVPFVLAGPQLLVGTIVNALIILATIKLGFRNIWPLLFLPSIAAVSRGLLRGPFTILVVYMLPIIWISNAILARGIQKFFVERNQNQIMVFMLSALTKGGFLLIISAFLISINFLPKIFIQTMGIYQILTALLGAGIAIAFLNFQKSKD